jgi:hypothetical protein
MNERAIAWHPVPDITGGFESISFAYEPRTARTSFYQQLRSATIVLNGDRSLSLQFTGIIALHFEDDCPDNFPLPSERPRLSADWMFPLLKIENSSWLALWPMWPNLVHYALLSLDDLVHVIAGPAVTASWVDGNVV